MEPELLMVQPPSLPLPQQCLCYAKSIMYSRRLHAFEGSINALFQGKRHLSKFARSYIRVSTGA
jgi:hypothetical protein